MQPLPLLPLLALTLGLASAVVIGLALVGRAQHGGSRWAVRLGFPVATFHSRRPVEVAPQTSPTSRFHTLEREGRTIIVENPAYANPSDRLRPWAGQDLLVGEVSRTGRLLRFRTALPTTVLWTTFLAGAVYFGVLLWRGAGAAGSDPAGLDLFKGIAAAVLLITVPALAVRRARRRASSFARSLGFYAGTSIGD